MSHTIGPAIAALCAVVILAPWFPELYLHRVRRAQGRHLDPSARTRCVARTGGVGTSRDVAPGDPGT